LFVTLAITAAVLAISYKFWSGWVLTALVFALHTMPSTSYYMPSCRAGHYPTWTRAIASIACSAVVAALAFSVLNTAWCAIALIFSAALVPDPTLRCICGKHETEVKEAEEQRREEEEWGDDEDDD
jgi:hypothetical protein